jgi:hypothetical protein
MNIEDAIVARLLAQSAVSDLTTAIRPYKLRQDDKPENDATPAILFTVDGESFDDQNIGGTTDLVTAKVTVSAISGKLRIARQVASAIRNNGTDPGTGMQGCKVRNGTVNWDAMLEARSVGIVMNEDGSDSGLYSVDSVFTVKYYETY